MLRKGDMLRKGKENIHAKKIREYFLFLRGSLLKFCFHVQYLFRRSSDEHLKKTKITREQVRGGGRPHFCLIPKDYKKLQQKNGVKGRI